MNIPYHVCPRCNGTGKISTGLLRHEVCPVCGGDRFIPLGWLDHSMIESVDIPPEEVASQNATVERAEREAHYAHDAANVIEEERRFIIEHGIGIKD